MWVNQRGVIVDPPPRSSDRLTEMGISQHLIEALILTHCHADHDAGTWQRLLFNEQHTVLTTPTIMGSFLRKYSAISGIEVPLLQKTFVFQPIVIGEPTIIYGAEFYFHYSLHTIPTIGFQVINNGQSLAFSGDTFYHPVKIAEMQERGILSPARAEQLINFPWHSKYIFHECGVPPIHTPVEQLLQLPEGVREKLYLIHTAEADVAGSGLKVARPGLEGTIRVETTKTSMPVHLKIWYHITRSPFLKSVPLSNAQFILENTKLVSVPQGTTIIEQGKYEDTPIYLIVSGIVHAYRDGVHVATRVSSEIVGEVSLLTRRKERTATCVTATDCVFILFTRYDFFVLTRGTSVSTQLLRLYEFQTCSVAATLAKNPFFERLTSLQKVELRSLLTLTKAAPGDRLWSLGDPIKQVLIIHEGEMLLDFPTSRLLVSSLLTRHPTIQRKTITLGSGAFIGELATLLRHGTHETALQAHSDVVYFSLSASDALSFFHSHPGSLWHFLSHVYAI